MRRRRVKWFAQRAEEKCCRLFLATGASVFLQPDQVVICHFTHAFAPTRKGNHPLSRPPF
jgi:hypothetical protein